MLYFPKVLYNYSSCGKNNKNSFLLCNFNVFKMKIFDGLSLKVAMLNSEEMVNYKCI